MVIRTMRMSVLCVAVSGFDKPSRKMQSSFYVRRRVQIKKRFNSTDGTV